MRAITKKSLFILTLPVHALIVVDHTGFAISHTRALLPDVDNSILSDNLRPS
jgi:hypothetical protein